MRTLRIIFMGSPDFAVPSLQKLIAGRHEVAAVVSGTDKRRGRGGKTTPTPVKAEALKHGIPVIEADSMKDEGLAEKLRLFNPDLFVVVAFKILPNDLLRIPKVGSVNLHASKLPAYRGAAPIHHAVMNGETETGSTIFFLDEGIDTGKIIRQNTVPIGPDETTGSVYTRLMESGSELLETAVDDIAGNQLNVIEQDHSQASKAPKLFDEDCKVGFDRSAKTVHNHIRGLSPFPCAYAILDGKRLKLISSTLPDSVNIDSDPEPGDILRTESGSVCVKCADGFVELGDVRYEGKKQMPAPDFFNGYQGEMKLHRPE